MVPSLIGNQRHGSADRRAWLKRVSRISIGVLCTLCGGIPPPARAGHAPLVQFSAATGPAAKPAADSSAEEVKIDNFTFTPAVLTVAAGTKVTWINHDDIPHTVVSTKKQFRSPALDTDERFSHTFGKAGTYPYYCSVHPHMTGKVIVR